MRIRVIGWDRQVALDGNHVQTWPKGSEHDVTDAFAAPLVRDGWAEPVLAPGPSETKVVEPAETKAGSTEQAGREVEGVEDETEGPDDVEFDPPPSIEDTGGQEQTAVPRRKRRG